MTLVVSATECLLSPQVSTATVYPSSGAADNTGSSEAPAAGLEASPDSAGNDNVKLRGTAFTLISCPFVALYSKMSTNGRDAWLP